MVSCRVRIPDWAAPLANSPNSMHGMRIKFKADPKTLKRGKSICEQLCLKNMKYLSTNSHFYETYKPNH